MRATACFVFILILGCGAKSGLEVSGGSAGGGPGSTGAGAGGPGGLLPAPCRILDSWTVYAGPDLPAAAAVAEDAGRIGILYGSDSPGARELRYGEVQAAAPSLTSWITVASEGVITQSGLVAHRGRFFAAWVDAGGAVHVGVPSDGFDVSIGHSLGLGAATVGVTGAGRLVVFWAEEEPGGTTSLFASTSVDGQTFGAPALVATTLIASALAIAPAPSGALLAWSGRASSDESELHVATVDEKGAPILPDAQLTHHPGRYVYDVGVARAKDAFVVATTDSRVDIGTVPLYATTLSLAGAWTGADTRLTFSGGHEKLDLAFDGVTSVLGYDEFISPGSQVFVRQLDAQGQDVFGALQVSTAKFLESQCCTRTSDVAVSTDGEGRAMVFWTEAVARPHGTEGHDLEAARLDCALR